MQVLAHGLGNGDNYRILSSILSAANEANARDSHVDRMELVNRILDVKDISASSACARLSYVMEQLHFGALIWSEMENTQLSTLEDAARTFAHSAGAQEPLILVVGSATLWVWCDAKKPLDCGF